MLSVPLGPVGATQPIISALAGPTPSHRLDMQERDCDRHATSTENAVRSRTSVRTKAKGAAPEGAAPLSVCQLRSLELLEETEAAPESRGRT